MGGLRSADNVASGRRLPSAGGKEEDEEAFEGEDGPGACECGKADGVAVRRSRSSISPCVTAEWREGYEDEDCLSLP